MEYEAPNTIAGRLKGILNNRFELDMDAKEEQTLSLDFLGAAWGLSARDLLYLFLDVEKEFGITIPEEDVAAGNFNSFDNIMGIIRRQVQEKAALSATLL